MSNVVTFVPRRDTDVLGNIREFIELCRTQLTVFGSDLNWEANYWPKPGVTFGNLSQRKLSLSESTTLLEPFLSFSKAYFRYSQGIRVKESFPEMRALKVLEAALVKASGRAEITEIDCLMLDRAAALARENYSPGVAYHAGAQLEKLAEFLSDNALVPRILQWVSPIERPSDSVRTGQKARERRDKKLPDSRILEALADIYASKPTVARDIFTTSTSVALLSAPSRLSEVLALTQDCEVWETCEDGSVSYGWRFFPGKGAPPMIKWVPAEIADLAGDALSRIRGITADARWLARWFEDRPEEFPRHGQCPEADEDQPLTITQVAGALGMGLADDEYVRREMVRIGFSSRFGSCTLRKLNVWARSQLPTDFPWLDSGRGVKYSDALFCMLSNQLNEHRRTIPIVLWTPSVNTLNDDLNGKSGGISIFDRHAISFEGGARRITSHAFRHLINTLAQRGGLSQREIARWSGRADQRQNYAYDHMSEFEIVEMIRRHDPDLRADAIEDKALALLADKVPIARSELDLLAVPTAHVTEFGYCVHDYVMAPCQRFRDCLNCNEQVCVKGDHRLSRMKLRHSDIGRLIEKAKLEISAGTSGADRWLEVHEVTFERLGKLIEIMESSDTPDGALIRLTIDRQFSPVARAISHRGRKDSMLHKASEGGA